MPPEPSPLAADEALSKPKEGCARLLRFPAPEHSGVHLRNEPACRKARVDNTAVASAAKQEDIDTKTWFPARTVFDDSTPVRRRIDSDLSFESRFESGNLQRAVRTGEFEYNLTLRADVNTGKAQWFYFLVQRMQKGSAYRFNITNFYKDKSMYNMGLQPLMWSTEDAAVNNLGWRRLGSEISYYENGLKQDNGSNFFTLSFKMTFPYSNDSCYIAMCYPYTFSDLQKYLRSLEKNPIFSRNFSRTELCKTLAGNSCDLLQITNSECPTPIRLRKAIVLTSRVHPGETNASFIMKGVLDFLVSSDRLAVALRNTFVFYVVPMLNPDGVINGFYRASLSGDDLNRQWSDPNKKHHSTIYHCKQLIKRLVKDERLLFFCDFHGHSTKRNAFMYGCPTVESSNAGFLPKEIFRREMEFPKLFSKKCEHFSFKDCKFETDRGKDNSGRVIIFREFGLVHSFTLEASLFGREVDGSLTHFSQQDFEEIGNEFCRCMGEYAVQNESWALGEAAMSELQAALKNDNPGPGAAVLDSYLKSLKLIRDKRQYSEPSFDLESSQNVENWENEGSRTECCARATIRRQTPADPPCTADCQSPAHANESEVRAESQQSSHHCYTEDDIPEVSARPEFADLSARPPFEGLRQVLPMRSGSCSSREATPQQRVAKICTSFTFDVLLRNQVKSNQPSCTSDGSPIRPLQPRPEINYQMWRSIRTANRRGPVLPTLSSKDSKSQDHEDQGKSTRPLSNENLSQASSIHELFENPIPPLMQSIQPIAIPVPHDRLISKSDEVLNDWRETGDDIGRSWQHTSRCESPWRGCLPVENDLVNVRASTQVCSAPGIKRSCIAGCTASKTCEPLTQSPSRPARGGPEPLESMTVWPYIVEKSEPASQRRAVMSLTHRRKAKDLDRDDIGVQKGVLISFLRRRR